MALFGRGKKKSLVQQAATRSWKNEEEREALLVSLRDAELAPGDALPLIWVGDAGVRQVGLDLIFQNPDHKVLLMVAGDMIEQPPHKRTYVTKMFGNVADGVMRQVIEGLLDDRTTQRQRLGWEMALALEGELGRHFLTRAVNDAPSATRVTALQRLLRNEEPKALSSVLTECAKSEDPRLSSTAMQALVSVYAPEVVDLMVDRFARGDATSREMAQGYLSRAAGKDPAAIRTRMLELLSEGEDSTRRGCVEILLASGNREEAMQEVLRFCKGLVGWLRARVLETLLTFGDDVLRPAVKLLDHPDEDVRTAALVLAENFNDPRIVGPVSRLLKDEDWWLRISACDTLGRVGDERAVKALVEALEDDDARWAAIDALARIGSVQALKPLSGLLRDKRVEVRLEVIKAFSRFSDKRLLSLLQSVKERDPSSEVRTRASEVLREMGKKLQIEVGDVEQGTSAVSAAQLRNPIDKLLAQIREQGASDLHLTGDEPRDKGLLSRMDLKPVPAAQCEKAIMALLQPRHKELLQQQGHVDLCHSIPEVGRYRANIYRQRRGLCAAFRVIPNLPPTFADLRLPGQLTQLLDYHQGIICVSGPAASGKSTTLAAIVNLINETKSDHVITLEDPIEFVHPVKTALVNQREVGSHTASFARALRGALREDPDVIMVGEMRDAETVRMALEAAETGHLVIATMHTTSAVSTVERIVKSFPPEEQAAVRMGLSESLKYVVSQQLIRRKDGQGRVAIYEVLKGTFSIGTLIRDNKTYQIPGLMQIGRKHGMQTVDMALMDLVEADLVAPEDAWRRAQKPETFEAMCDGQFMKDRRSKKREEVA